MATKMNEIYEYIGRVKVQVEMSNEIANRPGYVLLNKNGILELLNNYRRAIDALVETGQIEIFEVEGDDDE